MNARLKEILLELRPMQEEDLDAVIAIEEQVYEFPWTQGIFKDCLRVGYCCWVATSVGQIIGYGVMSVAVDECHILNLCIRPDYQRLGLGRRLIGRLLRLGKQHGAETAFLEVRESNQTAQGLYRRLGFVEVGRRRDYYPADGQGREDALLLSLNL